MPKYKKRPEVVDAIKWTGSNRKQVLEFVGQREIVFMMDMSVVIYTREGDMKASIGDWIIKGTKGEFYPLESDYFDENYEPVR